MKIYIVTVIIEVSWPNALPDSDDVHYASSLEKCMEFLVTAHLDQELELDSLIQISTDVVDEYFSPFSIIDRKTLGEWIKWEQH